MIRKMLAMALSAGLIFPAAAADFNLDQLELKQVVGDLNAPSPPAAISLPRAVVPAADPTAAEKPVAALALECRLDQARKTCAYSDGSSLSVVSCLQESGWLLCYMDRPSPPVEFRCLAHPQSGSWYWFCAPYGGSQ